MERGTCVVSRREPPTKREDPAGEGKVRNSWRSLRLSTRQQHRLLDLRPSLRGLTRKLAEQMKRRNYAEPRPTRLAGRKGKKGTDNDRPQLRNFSNLFCCQVVIVTYVHNIIPVPFLRFSSANRKGKYQGLTVLNETNFAGKIIWGRSPIFWSHFILLACSCGNIKNMTMTFQKVSLLVKRLFELTITRIS